MLLKEGCATYSDCGADFQKRTLCDFFLSAPDQNVTRADERTVIR
jgi:hypothetical protein